jgi:disulfide bond formation protein DsbB
MNRQLYLFLTWIIALTALLATLYGSEIMKLPICHLCWYQRICFYPLVVILGMGAYENDIRAAVYALPLCALGAAFAGYQTFIQWFPQYESIGVCGLGPSCATMHMKLAGFITFPLLSLGSALCMIALLLLSFRTN